MADVGLASTVEPMRDYLEALRRDFDQYKFQLAVANTGESTLHDFLLELVFVGECEIYRIDRKPALPGQSERDLENVVTHHTPQRWRFQKDESGKEQRKLFPTDRIPFPMEAWYFNWPAGSPMRNAAVGVRWTIYLDDTRPTSGEIDVSNCIRENVPTARKGKMSSSPIS
jgi:hypothetical protein